MSAAATCKMIMIITFRRCCNLYPSTASIIKKMWSTPNTREFKSTETRRDTRENFPKQMSVFQVNDPIHAHATYERVQIYINTE